MTRVLTEERTPLNRNFFDGNETLKKLLKEKLDDALYAFADEELPELGRAAANEIDERARHTDREGAPRLEKYDRFGNDQSKVWVNEGYEKTVQQVYDTGIVGYVHEPIPALGRKGNYLYSFTQGFLVSHAEAGFYCPVTLTMATAYLLDHFADERVRSRFLPHVCSTGDLPLYEGATFLTERQGGSDVGANVVKAAFEDGEYRLYGEKYFASNAGMAGVAMVLARIEGAPAGSKGLTLFAVPWKVDGELNGIKIRRLKDKLGVRAVPSGEVEFDGAKAYVVGDPSKGIYYMLEALNLSRICNAVASIGIMRRALLEAKDYAEKREAFGAPLTQYPMIKDSLGKMAATLHAETVSVFELISLYDRVSAGDASREDALLVRLLIALLKKETAENAIHFSHEAIEMHGGNGYIEDFVTPRLLRDAQVLTVWEGTANILAMELIRLLKSGIVEIFETWVHKQLAAIQSSSWHDFLKGQGERILEELKQFERMPSDLQSYEAKRMMQEMTKLTESLFTAAFAVRHGERELALCEVFCEETWETRSFGQEMKTSEMTGLLMRNV
ncbi:acyl-CoA dehydrogenase family protein [Jeotgalibacillus haloalkalitolerans]|uniref:Acyl-CoA dehydrogenase family protein n=1 Tax=Jeotgalibacillus haloalkalitolerans TaxID=3104292 RepID=A0ABU5KJK2_9BACL|nr:acyl-CoA dehydrogenase family protein [Jeotgalibacillus sp. HH7-29]MDZ5711440.1 acyl-CoA dehydrogenase family protein [Jeotgalibacillus sp. HH7-29]